jgi:hypothetical protein
VEDATVLGEELGTALLPEPPILPMLVVALPLLELMRRRRTGWRFSDPTNRSTAAQRL